MPTEPPDAAASVRDSGSAGPDHRGCWSGTISIVSQRSELRIANDIEAGGLARAPSVLLVATNAHPVFADTLQAIPSKR